MEFYKHFECGEMLWGLWILKLIHSSFTVKLFAQLWHYFNNSRNLHLLIYKIYKTLFIHKTFVLFLQLYKSFCCCSECSILNKIFCWRCGWRTSLQSWKSRSTRVVVAASDDAKVVATAARWTPTLYSFLSSVSSSACRKSEKYMQISYSCKK